MNIVLKHKHRIILMLILICLLIKGFYGEKILANGGLGFDGVIFADLTANAFKYLSNHTIDNYYFQRIGIPLVLHTIFKIFNIYFSESNIIQAFLCLNIFCIILGAIYYFLISSELKLKPTIEIIGFSSLFFCFPILKLSMFYPILMDIPCFTLSIIFLYYYLKDKSIICLITLFLGAFIFPNFILLSILLFFKKTPTKLLHKTSVLSNNKSQLMLFLEKYNSIQILLLITTPLFLVFLLFKFYYFNSFDIIQQGFRFYPGKTIFVLFSFFLAILYLCFLNFFKSEQMTLTQLLKSFRLIHIFSFITLFICVTFIINSCSSKVEANLTLDKYLTNIINQVVKNPLNFIVSHTFYFGAMPLLLFFILKDVKKEILNLGFGMLFFYTIIVFFSVGNESRQIIPFFPFLTFLSIISLNKYWNISIYFSGLFSIICLAISHFWYQINAVKTGLTYFTPSAIFTKFPAQRYFMFQGPWVSNYMYKIHLFVCIFILVVLWFMFKKSKLIYRNIDTFNDKNI